MMRYININHTFESPNKMKVIKNQNIGSRRLVGTPGVRRFTIDLVSFFQFQAYVDHLSEALSYEVSSKGVTIQTIDPSYVCTGMTEFRLNPIDITDLRRGSVN